MARSLTPGSRPISFGELSVGPRYRTRWVRARLDLDTLLYALLLALIVSLPFEPIRPLFSLGFMEMNHLKLLLGAASVVWIVALVRTRPTLRMPIDGALAATFLALAALSSVLAPSHQSEALKFVGRLGSGLVVVFLARHVVTGRATRVTGLLSAACLGAATSAILGLGEVAGWPALDPILRVFKVAPTRVGGDLRLSGSFQYATIAAMYFELAVPLAVVLAATSRARWQRWAAAVGGGICSMAVALSLTRAGVLALAAALALLCVIGLGRPALRRLVLPTALAVASGGFVLAGLSLRLADFGARFGTENDWGWYAASYAAPDALTIQQGAPTQTMVTATNTGQVTGTTDGDRAFGLGYRWLSADASSQLELPATVLSLPREVQPGDAVQLSVNISGRLPPGDYRLAWGMLQEHVLWFHDRGFPDAETAVHVAPGSTSAELAIVSQHPREDSSVNAPAPVPRAELWRAALQMFGQRPLLGFGPDNFRHLYGGYLGLPTWDQRVHANNLYLELLADLGVLGAVAFGLVVMPAIVGVADGLRTKQSAVERILLAGLGASLLAFFVHGTLDYFLDFTPVYVLFWLIVGLSAAVSRELNL